MPLPSVQFRFRACPKVVVLFTYYFSRVASGADWESASQADPWPESVYEDDRPSLGADEGPSLGADGRPSDSEFDTAYAVYPQEQSERPEPSLWDWRPRWFRTSQDEDEGNQYADPNVDQAQADADWPPSLRGANQALAQAGIRHGEAYVDTGEINAGSAASEGSTTVKHSALPRPLVYQGMTGPEKIEFGIYGKAFYGILVKANAFVVDIVTVMRWKDPRVTTLIPSGQTELVMNNPQSINALWLPQVEITNRDIRLQEVISTTVTVHSDGNVTKVERALTQCKTQFNFKEFPFDYQDLVVRIASTKYMLGDLVLKPIDEKEKISGVRKGFMDYKGFTLISTDVAAYEDIDGSLSKSRGTMTIRIHRDFDKYWQAHLIPCMLLSVISFGVFWFPFEVPFITPRIMMSIVSLWTFTNLVLKLEKVLPDGAPFCWSDLFNQNVMLLMYMTLFFNSVCEGVYHQLEVKDMGRRMNHECKILMPLTAGLVIGFTYHYREEHTLDLGSVVTKACLFTVVVLYALYAWARLRRDEKMRISQKLAEAVAQEKLLSAGDAPPPPDAQGGLPPMPPGMPPR